MKKFPGTSKLLLLAAVGIVAALAIRAIAEDQPGKEGPDREIAICLKNHFVGDKAATRQFENAQSTSDQEVRLLCSWIKENRGPTRRK